MLDVFTYGQDCIPSDITYTKHCICNIFAISLNVNYLCYCYIVQLLASFSHTS